MGEYECGFHDVDDLFRPPRSVNALGPAPDELSTGFTVAPGPGDRTVRAV